MDSRVALKKASVLRFNDKYECIITGELGRGGSSIVYNAFYRDSLGVRKKVRIKECYPFKCILKREKSGNLFVPESEKVLFEKCKQKMIRAYQLGNEFFCTDGLTNLTVNTYDIFEANNTLYIVSAFSQGKELSYESYETVKDSIAVVKSVADTIRKIHNKGFLYLDIKPRNIFTLEETTELIQLFDFDTVISISEGYDMDDKISYTRGYAALEQETENYRQIGRHTDVYGIGALLFYMIFHRVPNAFDCESSAEYDFSRSRLCGHHYQDTLYFRLTDFFHHTLADYYLNRFSNMETVVERLSELVSLAETADLYVLSSKISDPALFLGRSKETCWITEKLLDQEKKAVFVVGMGGIGKSTLVRYCVKKCKEKLDTVLYLDYPGSIQKMIIDDYSVQLHSIRKDEKETDREYFNRKLGLLRELGIHKKCVLVIDNYTGEETEDFARLLQLGWNLIFITRDKALCAGYEALEVGPLREQEDLMALLAKNAGRSFSEVEQQSAADIIDCVHGHTLILELLGKQIGSPVYHLSVEKSAEIVRKNGFSCIAPEKIDYQKDSILYHNTIKQVIAGLFETTGLKTFERALLKILSLFGRMGIPIDQLCTMLEMTNKESIRVLYHQGWLYIEDTVLTMHPVIREFVSDWKLSEAAKKWAFQILAYLYRKIETKTSKMVYLNLAMSVLEEMKRESEIYAATPYQKLLYVTLRDIPYENEAFIQENSEGFLTLCDKGHEKEFLIICERFLEVLYESKQFEKARKIIRQVRAKLTGCRNIYAWGRYYCIVDGYYDTLLDGAYYAVTDEEKKLVGLIMDALNKAIPIFRFSREEDAGILLVDCMLGKACILIRSGMGSMFQVRFLLKKIKKLMDSYAKTNSRQVRNYSLTLAWFHTYLDENIEKTRHYLEKAAEITDIICVSELAKIDEYFSIAANIYLEWGQFDEAAGLLLQSIGICEKHLEITAYARRQLDLLEHLAEVYHFGRHDEKCQAVLTLLETKISKMNALEILD